MIYKPDLPVSSRVTDIDVNSRCIRNQEHKLYFHRLIPARIMAREIETEQKNSKDEKIDWRKRIYFSTGFANATTLTI